MKLKELAIQNFMPYKDRQTVRFPQHGTQNVMLLFGDNMRGKTCFLNSIRWGFYGNAIGRHMRSIPRVHLVNSEAAAEGDWSMSVAIKFSDADKEYELRRQIGKKKHVSQPRTDADFEENIGLRIDGDSMPGDLVENKINQVMPEEISRFFLFDGELLQEYENLLIEDSTQGEKIKTHIEQALGVPALIHARDEFASLLKDAVRIQAKEAKKNTELKHFADQQKKLENDLTVLGKELRKFNSLRLEVQKKIDDIDDELKNTEIIQQKRTEIDKLSSKKTTKEEQLNTLENKQRTLLQSAWQDVLHGTVAPWLVKLRERRDSLQSAVSKKAIRDSQILELQKSLDDIVCPTCHQDLPDESIELINYQIQCLKAEAELSDVDPDEIFEINTKVDQLSKIQSQGEGRRLRQNVSKKRELQVELINIESKLGELEKEIRGYDTSQIIRQRKKRDLFVGELSKIDNEIGVCKDSINEKTREQNHIATLISKDVGGQGQKSSIRVNLYKDLQSIFSQGIDQLRDSLREEVEHFSTSAFAELTTEKTYKGLQINSNYGLSIIDQAGRILKERSAGAEQIVALSLIDGLNRTARNAGAIIMDTPLGRLDPKHRSNILKYIPNMADQVVLLVHEGEIDPQRDIDILADRIGARYEIQRISATESSIEKRN